MSINSGKHRSKELVKLVHHKEKASKEDILKALEGALREESLFELKQATEHYCFFQNQTSVCDKKIEEQMVLITAKYKDGDITRLKEMAAKKHARKNNLKFNFNPYLHEILEIDASQICGFSDDTALTLFAEVGNNILFDGYKKKKNLI